MDRSAPATGEACCSGALLRSERLVALFAAASSRLDRRMSAVGLSHGARALSVIHALQAAAAETLCETTSHAPRPVHCGHARSTTLPQPLFALLICERSIIQTGCQAPNPTMKPDLLRPPNFDPPFVPGNFVQ
jgi:hypothetical protein